MRCKVGLLGSRRLDSWSVSTASLVSSYTLAEQAASPVGFAISPSGEYFYVMYANISDGAGRKLEQFTMSSLGQIATATFTRGLSVNQQNVYPSGLHFRSDGLAFYIIDGGGNDSFEQWSLTAPWNISTATIASALSGPFAYSDQHDIALSETGDRIYWSTNGGGTARIYEMATATNYEVAGATSSQSVSVAAQDSAPRGMAFKPDGTRFFFVGQSTKSVYEYELSVPWDISSASYVAFKNVQSEDASPVALGWNSDGTKMYVLGGQNNSVYEYDV